MIADAARLDAIPRARLRALGDRLREVGIAAAWDDVSRVGRGVPIELRRPLRVRRLGARTDPAGVAVRLLCLGDRVALDVAARALGDLAPLLDGGLLGREADDVVAHVELSVADGHWVFADPLRAGGDGVMGIGVTTRALLRVCEGERGVAALDLGCGGGVLAIALARRFERVVATDLSPRAATFARLNVALHGQDHVEVRVGDLFAPVAGERFDLVASQPPFIPGSGSVTMHGGARGDEIVTRVLGSLGAHLASDGRALILGQWPLGERTALSAASAALVDPALGLTLLEWPTLGLDEHVAAYTALDRGGFDEGYRAAVQDHHARLAGLGITGLAQGLAHVDRRNPGLRARVALASPRAPALGHGRVADAVRACGVLHAGGLLDARLRLAEGLRLAEVVSAPGTPPRWAASVPGDPTVERAFLNAPVLELLRALDRAPDVRTAFAAVGPRHGLRPDKAVEVLSPLVADALGKGLLRVRPNPSAG